MKGDEAKSRMVSEVEMVARASAFLAATARAQGPGRGATMQALVRRLGCHLWPPPPPPLPANCLVAPDT
jgi:hypothetical protein